MGTDDVAPLLCRANYSAGQSANRSSSDYGAGQSANRSSSEISCVTRELVDRVHIGQRDRQLWHCVSGSYLIMEFTVANIISPESL